MQEHQTFHLLHQISKAVPSVWGDEHQGCERTITIRLNICGCNKMGVTEIQRLLHLQVDRITTHSVEPLPWDGPKR
jgi:hypothetical protein